MKYKVEIQCIFLVDHPSRVVCLHVICLESQEKYENNLKISHRISYEVFGIGR